MGYGEKTNTKAWVYADDDYLRAHPTLYEEDSKWKFSKIVPLVDEFMQRQTKDKLVVLDVGGGAGRIVALVCDYLRDEYRIKVDKILLDLSPGALKVQTEANADCLKALNEDVRRTSLAWKQVDLALMIDVLEHIPNPEEALEELRRISRFVIFKVPLEDCAFDRLVNLVFDNLAWRNSLKNDGHCNFYSEERLQEEIRTHCGRIVHQQFSDIWSYIRKHSSTRRMNTKQTLTFLAPLLLCSVSPRLNSKFFMDHLLLLVECN